MCIRDRYSRSPYSLSSLIAAVLSQKETGFIRVETLVSTLMPLAVGCLLYTSKVMNAIVDATKEYDDGETAICFMGHGTEAESNQVYTKMQETLKAAGHRCV